MLDHEFFYIISIPVYVIFLISFIIKKLSISKIILYSFFYLYIISLVVVTIFPIPIQWLKEIWIYWWNNNFIPFYSIIDILSNSNLGIITKLKQILGNIIIFIPIGFLVPFIWKSKKNITNIFLLGIIFSFSIESLQYIISLLLWFSYKVTDIDDILLNTLWAIIGFFLYRIFQRGFTSEDKN